MAHAGDMVIRPAMADGAITSWKARAKQEAQATGRDEVGPAWPGGGDLGLSNRIRHRARRAMQHPRGARRAGGCRRPRHGASEQGRNMGSRAKAGKEETKKDSSTRPAVPNNAERIQFRVESSRAWHGLAGSCGPIDRISTRKMLVSPR
jgi:hypothetical protein